MSNNSASNRPDKPSLAELLSELASLREEKYRLEFADDFAYTSGRLRPFVKREGEIMSELRRLNA